MTTTLNISPQGIPVTNHGNEFLENVGNGMLKKLESMRNSFSELSNHYAVLY